MKKIIIFVGSLRKASIARKIAKNVMELFPAGYEPYIYEIANLPLYNFDFDNPDEKDIVLPESYTELRNAVKEAAGVLFISPENNRLIPACLKNTIDICSKPNNDVSLKGKVAGIITHSVGAMGGYSSQKTIRLALSYFDMKITGQPEVFLGKSASLFDEGSDKINNPSTIEFLQGYINKFISLIEE